MSNVTYPLNLQVCVCVYALPCAKHVCTYVCEYAFRLLVRPVWMTCLSNVRAKLWIAPGRERKGGRILTQLPAFHCLDLERCSMLPASSLPVWERGALGYSHFHYVLNWADFLPWTRCTHARTHTWIYMHAHTNTHTLSASHYHRDVPHKKETSNFRQTLYCILILNLYKCPLIIFFFSCLD